MSSNIEFISLSSGSSGNCYYFANDEISFLIDAGVGSRTLKKRLGEYGKNIEDIKFILITHNHIDHIKHLGSIADRYSIPVYTSELVHNSLVYHFCTTGRINQHKRVIEKNKRLDVLGVGITCFEVPHDSEENLGFFIEIGDNKLTIITDIGRITDNVITFCKQSQNVVIESNYDDRMLNTGKYPAMLIERIKGGNGHLSNSEAAKAIKTFYHKGLKNIFLCHLSQNNNTPELAYEASSKTLMELGIQVGTEINLHCLPRRDHKHYWF
jgi:phosphoribosyl 1,2-cyclic phosphodiesterase